MRLSSAIARASKAPLGRPAQEFSVGAPMGGVNSISGGLGMPPGDCMYVYNMTTCEYGMRPRLGSREWVTGLDGPVLSELPFTGSAAANNKLFACTATGIWDVTDSTATPTQVVTFGITDTTSGYASSVVMVTSAGHFLLVCDESNGYYVYTESTATWAKIAQGAGAGQVNGVNPATFVHVTVHKRRVWFTQKDTGIGWYLPVNSYAGTVTAFYFGAQFPKGGFLVALASWTGDGGVGVDDHLVAVSSGGDVVVYKGNDPGTAGSWDQVGIYYAGAVPTGRRITTDYGGDLGLMTSSGILPVSVLPTGAVLSANQYATAKIANLFTDLQTETAGQRGWSMAIHPLDGTLIVIVPSTTPTWLALNLTSKAWSVYRDLPASKCAVPWAGSLYFGTDDGRIMIQDGNVDGVTLADPDSYAAIQWSVLTSFQNLGSPRQKQAQHMRATFRGPSGPPPYEIQARYAWNDAEIASAPTATAPSGAALWDVAQWDEAVWAGEYTAHQKVWGATGIGPEVAFAVRGASTARDIWIGVDGTYSLGGLL